MKTCWVDCETTGLDPVKHRIIELAAIYEEGPNNDTFHEYCLPLTARPENYDVIEKITGITWESLEEYGLTDRVLYGNFKAWLGEHMNPYDPTDKAIFAGYCAEFDRRFITGLFERNHDTYTASWFHAGTLDVVGSVYTDARISGEDRPPKMRLSAIADLHGITFKAHSAMDDILATRQIQKNIEYRLTLRDRPDPNDGIDITGEPV